MKRRRLKIVACKRCDKPVTTLIKALVSPRSVQDKYAGICENCMSDSEKAAMDAEVRRSMASGFRGM